MLYSGLDADQQRTYDRLVRAGVLPDRRCVMMPLDPTADIGRAPGCAARTRSRADCDDAGPGELRQALAVLLSNKAARVFFSAGCAHLGMSTPAPGSAAHRGRDTRAGSVRAVLAAGAGQFSSSIPCGSSELPLTSYDPFQPEDARSPQVLALSECR